MEKHQTSAGRYRKADKTFRHGTYYTEAEEELRRSEQRQRAILDNIPDIAWLKDVENRFIAVNEAFGRTCGRRPEELAGKTDFDIWPREIAEKYVADDREIMTSGRQRRFEESFVDREGKRKWVEAIKTPIFNDEGQVIGMTGIARDITARKTMEEALQASERRYRRLFESAKDGILVLDPQTGKITHVNQCLTEMLGHSPGEVLGKKLWELDLFKEGVIGEPALRELRTRGYLRFDDVQFRTKHGRTLIVDIYLVDNRRVVQCNIRDVTERRQAEEELRRSEQRQRAILDNIPDIAWLKDVENRFIAVNEAFGRTCGRRPEELAGKTDFDIWPREIAEKYVADDREIMTSGRQRRFEESFVDREGKRKWVEAIKTPIFNDEGQVIGMTGIARDITARKTMEETIRLQAYHDSLTGLPNRLLFLDHLRLEMARARRKNEKLAVLFLDIDRFKSINDTLGHRIGDRLIKRVAKRLRAVVRQIDTVARSGGDEYTILLPQITRPEYIAKVAQKILLSFDRPFTIEGHQCYVALSIGISVYPGDGGDAETLLKNAAAALYHIKENGRNNYQFYNPDINNRTLERMRLENSLRRMVAREELVVHYQPQVQIATGRMECAEALVRWQHPELGLLKPVHFISLAEETGLIIPIGEKVLREACAQCKTWQEAGYPPLRVTVNLSARQFLMQDIVALISRTLEETGLAPELLELEITESVAMRNTERTVPHLSRLTEMGVVISIDDFGTGYSSLSYLKKLPIQKIKIDKSFISGLPGDTDDKAIVSAVIAMAHTMRLKVVAEGVETEEQLRLLRSGGCDAIQGYFSGKPLPAAEFEKMLSQGTRGKEWGNRIKMPG